MKIAAFFTYSVPQLSHKYTPSTFQPRQSFYEVCNVTHQHHVLHPCSSQQRA